MAHTCPHSGECAFHCSGASRLSGTTVTDLGGEHTAEPTPIDSTASLFQSADMSIGADTLACAAATFHTSVYVAVCIPATVGIRIAIEF